MGIRIHNDVEEVRELSRQVDQVRQDIDQAITQLSEARRRLPEPDAIDKALAPVPPEARRDLSNSCISLELALADALKGAYDIVAATGQCKGRVTCGT